MGETVPKIRDLNTIDGNATQEVKEQFQKGKYGHYGSPGSIKGRRGNTKRDCPGHLPKAKVEWG